MKNKYWEWKAKIKLKMNMKYKDEIAENTYRKMKNGYKIWQCYIEIKDGKWKWKLNTENEKQK